MRVQDLNKLIASSLEQYGFVKEKNYTFVKELKETYVVIGLQKAKFGSSYGLYLGIYFKGYKNLEGFPLVYKSNFTFSTDDLEVNGYPEFYYKYLDLDNDISLKERETAVRKELEKIASILDLLATKKGILELFDIFPKLKNWLRRDTYLALGMNLPELNKNFLPTVTHIFPDGTKKITFKSSTGKWIELNEKNIKTEFPKGVKEEYIKIDGKEVKLSELKNI